MSGTTGSGGSGQDSNSHNTNQSRNEESSGDHVTMQSQVYSMGDLLRSLAVIADQQAQQITLLRTSSTYLSSPNGLAL